MAKSPKQSAAAANAAVDAKAALLNGGSLMIYSGAVPATVATAISDQVLLAQLPLSATAFAAASAGSATANEITADVGLADNTATFFRACNDADAAVFQGTVGTSGADLNLNSTVIATGVAVSVTSFVLSETVG